MSNRPDASQEVEQTLQLARDEVEREVATYRMWLLGGILLVQLGLRVTGNIGSWVTIAFVAGLWATALGIRQLSRRLGAHLALSLVTQVFDLVAVAVYFRFVVAVDSAARVEHQSTWTIYLAGPLLLASLLIGSLRASRKVAAVGGLVALPLYFLVMVPETGFHPAQTVVGVLLLGTAAIGVASARRSRRNLDTLSRLQLLRRYLSPAAVERVLKDRPDAALALGGQLQTVTMLCADLRGFTSLSEGLEPAEVVRQLNAYHGAMVEQLDRHGGVLDKFIGDGTLAIFGLQSHAPDAGAGAALACARDMRRALARLNRTRAAQGAPPLQMGVGIHTGSVVVGNIGAPGRRLEFTVIGDAVNTASRIEGLTKQLGVHTLLSRESVERLEEREGLSPVPAQQVRGKAAPLELFSLEEPAETAEGAEALRLAHAG